MKLTLPISAAAHLALIALLFMLPETVSVPPQVDLSKAIAVVFAPPPPPPAPPTPAQPTPPPPVVAEQPPPPPEPTPPPEPAPPLPVEQPPPPPASVAEIPPPPPPKPEPKPIPKPRPRPQPVRQEEPLRQEQQQPMPQLPLPLPTQPTTSQAPQMASIPQPAPAPTISADYRTLLSGWLESHKRYPEEARQRGEEGRAVLRFRVDRYGRVLDYAVVSSTGFSDLDQAVENMMRGAVLPPFPPSMQEPEIEVSVTIRFGLQR